MTTYARINDPDFDCPFEVRADGSIHSTTGLSAPDVVHLSQPFPNDIEVQSRDWRPLTGFSGQDRYSGPVMHPSETLGGGLEEHVLANPGIYVVTEVRDDDGQFPDSTPIGWVILRHKIEHPSDCGYCAAGEPQQHTYQPPEA